MSEYIDIIVNSCSDDVTVNTSGSTVVDILVTKYDEDVTINVTPSLVEVNIIKANITGSVSSVGLSMPSGFTVTNSPITSSGVIEVTGAGDTSQYIRGDGSLATYNGGTVTSVGLSVPSAFTVSNSPITSSGTIDITGSGNVNQYVRGDGSLGAYNPSISGGGSSQSFYFNGGVASSVTGYKQMSKTANTGASTDFNISADGYIASFLTDAASPNQLNIPAGNWNFEIYFNSNSSGGSPSFYVELYKYNGTTFTLISSSSANPEFITNGTAVDLYTTALSVPETALLITDRLAIRVYVTHSSKTITMHTQSNNLSSVRTTFSSGITALNGLTTQVQNFAIGTSGSDFNISSSIDIHTFNLPSASASNRGLLTSANWSTFNGKESALTFTSPLSRSTNTISIPLATSSIDGYLNSTDWNVFNGKQPAGNYITSLIGEATGSGAGAATITLTNSAVIGKVLTGINITGGTVTATDSILTGFGKLQNQINGLIGSTIYAGVWNASTNSPTLASSVGTKGTYYVVSTSGSTNLNGITDWSVGDWAIYNGTAWNKVDNSDSVSSVNGQTGAVSLTTDNIAQGSTNLYFSNANARAALSFVAGSGAYNSTTGVITIPTNNNQITNGSSYIALTALSGTAPISYNNTTGAISITQAATAANGYLSSTDWNTFNGKQAAINGTGFVKASGTTISYDNSTYLTTGGFTTTAINSLYGYTPANGTLYLPLTGGTLSGALNGTSANFSSSVLTGSDIFTYNNGGIFFSGAATYTSGIFQNAGGLQLQSGGSPRLSITSVGNVLIGTTTDAGYKLDVNGTGRFSGSVIAKGTDATTQFNGFKLQRYNSSVDFLTISTKTPSLANSAVYFNDGNSNGFEWASGGTTTMSLSTTGAATFGSTLTVTGLTAGSAGNFVVNGGSGLLVTRTAAQVLSDIGAASSSSLSGYLPLTGGTLTGALTISYASPRFNISATTTSNSAYAAFLNAGGTGYIGLDNSTGSDFGGSAYAFNMTTSTARDIQLQTNNTTRLSINGSTGAATFSSSVTAASARFTSGASSLPTSLGQVSLNNQIAIGTDPINYATNSSTFGQAILNSYYASNLNYPRYLDIASIGSPDGTNGAGIIRFLTNPVTLNSPAVEQMRISSSGATFSSNLYAAGNVGIGTTSPTAKFQVYTDRYNDNLTFNGAAGFIIGGSIRQLSINSDDTSPYNISLQAKTNGNIAANIVLQSLGGNVGIGTTSPDSYGSRSSLSVNGTNGGIITLQLGGTKVSEIYAASGGLTQFTTTGSFAFSGGAATFSSLAGTGSRMVVASSTGLLSATTAAPVGVPTGSDGSLVSYYDGGVPIAIGRLNMNNATGYVTPTTGTSINLLKNGLTIINPAGTLAALTLTLPSSPAEGDAVRYTITQSVSSLSYSGGTVVAAPTIITGRTEINHVYRGATSSWY